MLGAQTMDVLAFWGKSGEGGTPQRIHQRRRCLLQHGGEQRPLPWPWRLCFRTFASTTLLLTWRRGSDLDKGSSFHAAHRQENAATTCFLPHMEVNSLVGSDGGEYGVFALD